MTQQILQMMQELKLSGMYSSFEALLNSRQQENLTTDELLNLLLQAEWDERYNKRLSRLIRSAKFRYQASTEEVQFPEKRNLDKNTFLRLASCNFIERKENILVSGPTGAGKSFIVSALGHEACRKGFTTIYFNIQKLFTKLNLTKADGSYLKEMTRIEKMDLLILDDFGMQALDGRRRMELLEIIEDRHGRKSTIICSQLPVSKWYDVIEDSTIADAIMDRMINQSHRLELKGESMRKK